MKKILSIFLITCIIALQFSIVGSADNTYPSFASLYSSTSGASIPVRTEPGIKSNPNSVVKGWLRSEEIVKVLAEDFDLDGDKWYLIGYGVGYNETGYVLPKYIGSFLGKYTTDADFEAKLNEQNFPESYKVKLRELHFLYPNWKFVAENINMNFADAVAGERANPGTKLVSASRDQSWRSTDQNTYNAATGEWSTYDGGWYSASQSVVEYFMDPRNMLDYQTVFVFTPHNYSSSYDTDENLRKILTNTFMSDKLLDDTSKTYFDIIKQAGINSGVSPLAMAAKFIQEQGPGGTGGNVTGNIEGYEGLYNFFNIGAYASGGMNAVQRGLWWAAGAGKGDTTYGRPWNTREKSITGGALWYAENYVNVGQNSYYYMNFNVKGSTPFTHQYATNIEDAAGKARNVSKGYTGIKDMEVTFYIPIYNNMPESTTLPTIGNNDNYLKSLEIDGYTLNFNIYTQFYELVVPYEQTRINILATPNSSTSIVSGVGAIDLTVGYNEIEVTVTAASGAERVYNITVNRKNEEFQATLTITTDRINPNLNEEFIATITFRGTNLSSIDSVIKYDENLLQIVSLAADSSNPNKGEIVISHYNANGFTSKDFEYKFKAIAEGDAEISVISSEVWPADTSTKYTPTGSAQISIIDKTNLSGNANLKELMLSDNIPLNPEFNKDVTTYNVTVDNSVEKVLLNALAEDIDAKITYGGSTRMKVGNNQRWVIVTAPDGTQKKYTINIYREPSLVEPIDIILNGNKVIPGNEFSVDIKIDNNSGFSALNFAVDYNSEYFTLTDAQNKTNNRLYMEYGSAFILDGAENYTDNGTILTLTFSVAENAPIGEYNFELIFGSACNEDFEELSFNTYNGIVSVIDYKYGDVNGDNNINATDIAMLRKYMANLDLLTNTSSITVSAGADANGDGKIDAVDLAMLRKYLANLDFITGESTVILGPKV